MDDEDRRVLRLLRRTALRVSMAETIDAFRARARCSALGDRADVSRAALRATMVKRAVDVPVFDELFDLYFSGLGEAIRRSADGRLQEALELERGGVPAASWSELERAARKSTASSSRELAQALLQNDTGTLEQLLREAAEQARIGRASSARYQEGRFSHGMAKALGLGALVATSSSGSGDSSAGADLPHDSPSSSSEYHRAAGCATCAR